MAYVAIKNVRALGVIAKQLGNRKRECRVHIVGSGEHETNLGFWDEGSRDQDYLVTATSGNNFTFTRAPQITNPFQTLNRPTVTLTDTNALVTVGVFCGKTSTMQVVCTAQFAKNHNIPV